MSLPKILLVEDHSVVQQSVSELIHSVYPDAVIDIRPGTRAALASLRCQSYTLVVSDLGFDGQIRFEIPEYCREKRIPCMVLTGHATCEFIRRALAQKVVAYMLKTSPLNIIRQGLTHQDAEHPFLCPASEEILQKSDIGDYFSTPLLNSQEETTLQLTIEGRSLHEIAELMGKSFHTVRAYRRDMLKKNNCTLPTLIKRYLAYHP